MPQNPTPLDEYVSVIFDHANDQSSNHHHPHHHSILLQTQSTSSQDTQTLFLVPSVTPNQQLTHQAPSQPQQQQQATASQLSLHLQSPTFEARHQLTDTLTSGTINSHHQQMDRQSLVNVATGSLLDSNHSTAIAVASPNTGNLVGNDLKNRLLLVTDLPGSSTILQVPSIGSTGATVIQVQPALQVSQQINLIQVPSPTLNLVQISNAASSAVNETSIGASTISSSVELVQVPTTVYLANSDQQLILCLPPEMTLQPSSSYIVNHDSLLTSVDSPQSQSASDHISIAKGNTTAAAVHTLSSDFNINQVAMAKLWHSDSDLVNRALTALGRHNSTNDSSSVLPLQHLHLNCSSGVTN